MRKPLLAITMGDPAGVGPETIVGAWDHPEFHQLCSAVVVGHPEILQRAVALRKTGAEVVTVDSPAAVSVNRSVIACLPAVSDEALDVPAGQIDARAGQAAYDALVAAAKLAISGEVHGIVTAPLNKAALWQAGHHYPGHTELLAELCGVSDFAMMLYLGPGGAVRGSAGLGVIHVTLHMALHDVFAQLSTPRIVEKIQLAHAAMGRLKGSPPAIGVCALNPHAGEEGLFGHEERAIIGPAVGQAQAMGLNVVGPLPTDTLMVRAHDGEFDAVVAMYHDQGHIALKLLGMHRAVNVTLGLSIVRTSVAHGTAFDLAWRGIAETSSMIEAVRVAARLAGIR